MKCLICNKETNNNFCSIKHEKRYYWLKDMGFNVYINIKTKNLYICKKEIKQEKIKQEKKKKKKPKQKRTRKCKYCRTKFKPINRNKKFCCINCNMKYCFKKRRKNDFMFKLRQNTSSLIYQSIKKNGYIKPKFPFNKKELFNHLNKEFPDGYNWDDYLKNNIIQLEHKIPLSWFNNETDFFKIGWNLNNLTFLTKEENIKKSNKYAIVNNIKYYDKEKAINKFKELYLSEN